jgi:hypothetical protein
MIEDGGVYKIYRDGKLIATINVFKKGMSESVCKFLNDSIRSGCVVKDNTGNILLPEFRMFYK